MKKLSLSGIIVVVIILALAFSNPSQRKYQEQIVAEFGQFHGGMSISVDQLLELGHGNRESFFLFSTYQYEMGNIGVKYWGVAGFTFFVKSYRTDGRINEATDEQGEMV